MSDIRLIWDSDNGVCNWNVIPGNLETGNDIESSIYISLFTDRLANEDDKYDGDRRGWWGDLNKDYKIGSRFYLLKRRKLTVDTANDAVSYAKEALQWMLDDGVIASLDVQYQIVYPSRLYLAITYQKPDGNTNTLKFGWAWAQVT